MKTITVKLYAWTYFMDYLEDYLVDLEVKYTRTPQIKQNFWIDNWRRTPSLDKELTIEVEEIK